MTSTTIFSSYEQACEQHRWDVPDRYNIAVDVCDRHPRDKLAMIHEDFRGRIQEVSSRPKVLLTNAANAGRIDRSMVEHLLILDDELLGRGSTAFDPVDTAAEDPAQLYYSSGTTGLAKGILHAHRYILAHEEFIYCHDLHDGEVFHGMGEWAWAAGICPLLGPWRLGAV